MSKIKQEVTVKTKLSVGNNPVEKSNEIKPIVPEQPKLKRWGHCCSVDMTFEEIQAQIIAERLEHHDGNRSKTARSLGITVHTVYNWLNRFGIK